jgi:hypothetical protein
MSPNRASWKEVLAVLAGLLLVLLAMEWKYPYYFLQDDNRDYMLPWMVHNWRSLMSGELALYNFHQYSGFPSLGSPTVALYIPGYLAMAVSVLLFGHVFASIDVLVFLHYMLAAVGWLMFFRLLGLSPLAAVWGALVCALNSFHVYAGSSWMCVSNVAACFPWMSYFGLALLRHPSGWNLAGLLAARLTLFYHAYVQYFFYAAILEMLLVWGILLTAPGGLPKEERRPLLLRYALSWLYVTLLSAPLLLPMLRQMGVSAFRRAPLGLREFSFGLTLHDWNEGLLHPFTFVQARHFPDVMPSLVHVGFLTVGLMVAAPLLLWRAKREQNRQGLVVVLLLLLLLTLSLSMGYFASVLYHVPIYNRFRWPFKLVLFANYFEVALAALALDRVLVLTGVRWGRIAGGLCLAVSLANALYLYAGYEPKPFRRHAEPVPLEDPLRDRLRDGKIFTLGYSIGYPRPLYAMGFDYATLWGLYHFAGYEPMVPWANYSLTLGLEYFSTFLRPPEMLDWERLRRWGVRWYMVSNETERYNETLRRRGLEVVHRDADRTMYRDPLAQPLVFWEDGRADPVDYRIETNAIYLRVSARQPGPLVVNFVWHERFRASLGTLRANREGQMELEVPAGEHSIEIRHFNPDFWAGLAIFVIALFPAAWHARRLSPPVVH